MSPAKIFRTTLPAAVGVLALAAVAHAGESSRTRKLEIGAPVPGFKLRTPVKRYVYRLTDFARPGKPRRNQTKHPVLLDFFRTDCKPCIESMPELVAIHEKYEARGLKVIVVALHEQEKGRDKLNAFLQKNALPFLVVEDPTDYAAERYLGKTISLPATFLIDADGVLKKAKYDAKVDMQTAFGADIEALLGADAPKKEGKGS